ncbi:hypothetical protein ACVXG8_27500 [Escherichia coli]
MDGFRLFRDSFTVSTRQRFNSASVNVDRGGGQHQRHRAFYRVLLRHQIPAGVVLACTRRWLTRIRLQQLERVGCLAHTFFFRDGEDLVLQVPFHRGENRLCPVMALYCSRSSGGIR